MKVLIADISWVIGCRRGLINAQRDSFLKGVPKFPGLDYKVFVGDGTPTGVDETDVLKSFAHAPKGTHELNDRNQPKMPFDYVPEADEVVLRAPDDLAHLAYKAQATWRWAFDRGYDYAFACFCDTYIDIPRLMASGFEKHPFTGMTYDDNRCPQGGCGYWLDRECLEILANERVTFWADDGWAGWTLQKHGIWLNNDTRYNYYPLIPTKQTDAISVHVSEHVLAPVSVYDTMQNIYKGMNQ
jgi:hypothetical protein